MFRLLGVVVRLTSLSSCWQQQWPKAVLCCQLSFFASTLMDLTQLQAELKTTLKA
jgi:hypothetical protein